MNSKIGLGWLPLILLAILGMSAQPALPIWLSGVGERFHLAPVQTGMIGSLELGCLALASIAWAVIARSERKVVWLYAALALGAVANFAAFAAGSVTQLLVCRALVGLSYGVALTEITRRAALTPNPHRVFALQQLGLVAFLTVYFATVPRVIQSYGPFSPFLYGAALSVLSLLSLIWVPPQTAATRNNRETAGAQPEASGGRRSAIVLALASLTLVFMTQGSIWPYITDAARNSGLRLEALGSILAVGAICNLAAPIAAERLGLRLGRTAPLIAGHAGLGAGILMVALPLGPAWFTVGSVALNLFLLFLMPFFLSTLAALDASGRSAAAAPAFFTVGGAIGPTLGGFVIGKAGMPVLGVLLAIVIGVGLTMQLSASRSITATPAD